MTRDVGPLGTALGMEASEDDADDAEGDLEAAKGEAAAAAFAAVKSGDEEGFKSALVDLVKLCMEGGYDE